MKWSSFSPWSHASRSRNGLGTTPTRSKFAVGPALARFGVDVRHLGVGGPYASAFGIGGGLVQVPAMVYLFAFPPHVATATSTLIIACTSLFGTASHALFGDVRWAPALLVAIGAGRVHGV